MGTGNNGNKRSGARRGVRVAATEAAKNFGALVDRVREDRATYIVERGGVPVAEIRPVERNAFTIADFKALTADLPAAGEEYARAVETAVKGHNRSRVRRNPWVR